MDFNPILTEIQGHIQSMSPDAQAVVAKMGGNTQPSPQATAAAGAPSVIPPGMLLPHPDSGPPAGNISMDSPSPLISMPSSTPQLVTGPNRGQATMSSGDEVHQGTLLGDQAERSRLLEQGPGVDQISHRIEGTGFGQNHPFLGKLLGGIAQTAGKIGDVGLSVLAPEVAAQIPGTSLHHQELLGEANHAVNQDLGNAQKQAQTASENATAQHTAAETPEVAPEAEARIGLEQAQTSLVPSEIEKNKAELYGLQNPWAKLPGNEPLGNVDQINKGMTDRYNVINKGPLPPEFTLPQNATKNDFDRIDKLLTAAETAQGTKQSHADSERLREATLGLAYQNAADKNLWSVPQTDGTNKVMQLRPGDTIPKGAVSLSGQNSENLKTGTADAPTIAALKFANDYLQTGAFTGPSDEALQDQFFQMAKPSTGFRMNQAQISQLHDMASWMDSWKGKAYHAVNGVWFAPDQRQNIVNTMNQLAVSKGIDVKALTGDTGPNPVNPQNRQGQPNAQQPAGGKQNDPLGIR